MVILSCVCAYNMTLISLTMHSVAFSFDEAFRPQYGALIYQYSCLTMAFPEGHDGLASKTKVQASGILRTMTSIQNFS